MTQNIRLIVTITIIIIAKLEDYDYAKTPDPNQAHMPTPHL